MKKMLIYVFVGLLVIAFYAGLRMRDPIPYDFEIVPQDGGFVIINTTPWADRNCDVSISRGNKNYNNIIPLDKKTVIFEGLENGVLYNINISRSDILGKIRYRKFQVKLAPHKIGKYTVLVGASVGKKWNLRQLSARKHLDDVFFGYRGTYEFDKSVLINNLINGSVKPDSVVIKECAAYFPRSTDRAMEQIRKWVSLLRQAGIQPVLATTVPITSERAASDTAVMESLNRFNASIRKYCVAEKIALLDLQRALSSDSEKGFLDQEYADLDGLHLVPEAYEKRLDPLLLKATDSVFLSKDKICD